MSVSRLFESYPPYKALFLVVVLTTVYLFRQWYNRSKNGKLPPGPRGLPLVGNTFQIGRLPWFQLTKWAKQYGPIYSLNLGNQLLVVLNNHKVATDLLDKRSTIYSDRPRSIMTGELLCGGFFFAFNSTNDLWKRLRRSAYEGLNFRSADVFQPVQEREAVRLADALIKDPANWMDHINRVTASSVLSICYSLPPMASATDPVITRINAFMSRIESAARPGEYLVEIFPWMLRLPKCMCKWRRDAEEAHRKDTNMFMEFHMDAKRRAASGNCGPCMSGILMQRDDVSDKEAAWLAGTLFGAGATTTAAAQHVFILAMVLYPEAMRKAQAEIDAVVGRSRLPDFSDRDKLPYVRAIIREIFRWRNIGPLGLPHYSNEDDYYEGYYIPKGTMIYFNQWAMNFDPEAYGDDLDEFRPERFLDETLKKEKLPPNTHGEGHTGFGYGRRKCIGVNIAKSTLFINIATTLWAFDLSKAKDEFGNEITPDKNAFEDRGLVVGPDPFPVVFTPRYPDVVAEITEHAHQVVKPVPVQPTPLAKAELDAGYDQVNL
ncbi:cytochrome P450 [Panus rudis PR-1116 ss-1]|nr:cytochrome P450 [Panus rudis PR-1116 ss-1]